MHLARVASMVIIRLAGQAQYRRSRLNSNVRPRKKRTVQIAALRSRQDQFRPLRIGTAGNALAASAARSSCGERGIFLRTSSAADLALSFVFAPHGAVASQNACRSCGAPVLHDSKLTACLVPSPRFGNRNHQLAVVAMNTGFALGVRSLALTPRPRPNPILLV